MLGEVLSWNSSADRNGDKTALEGGQRDGDFPKRWHALKSAVVLSPLQLIAVVGTPGVWCSFDGGWSNGGALRKSIFSEKPECTRIMIAQCPLPRPYRLCTNIPSIVLLLNLERSIRNPPPPPPSHPFPPLPSPSPLPGLKTRWRALS